MNCNEGDSSLLFSNLGYVCHCHAVKIIYVVFIHPCLLDAVPFYALVTW